MKLKNRRAPFFITIALMIFSFGSLEARKIEKGDQPTGAMESGLRRGNRTIINVCLVKKESFVQWDNRDSKLSGTEPEGLIKALQFVPLEKRKEIRAEVRLRGNASPEAQSLLSAYGDISKTETFDLQGDRFETFLTDWNSAHHLSGEFFVKIHNRLPIEAWYGSFSDSERRFMVPFDVLVKRGNVIFASAEDKEAVWNFGKGIHFNHDLRSGRISVLGSPSIDKMLGFLPSDARVELQIQGPAPTEIVQILEEKGISYAFEKDNTLKAERFPVNIASEILELDQENSKMMIAFKDDLWSSEDMQKLRKTVTLIFEK